MEVLSLHVRPVKSMAGHDVESAEVLPWGLADDRRWAVLTGDGDLLTAREHPPLLSFRARPLGNRLGITAPSGRSTTVDPPVSGAEPVGARLGRVRDAGDDAAGWLSAELGRAVRLVHQPDPAHDRPVKPKHGGIAGDTFNLSDAGPVLLTTRTSLQQLDKWVTQTATERGEQTLAPLSMTRFRPTVVVDGAAPFAEDSWRRIRVGGVTMRFGEVCDRCVMTTYDPLTLSKSHEPIRTLARHRAWEGATWFGVRFVPESTGTLHVGDEVVVDA